MTSRLSGAPSRLGRVEARSRSSSTAMTRAPDSSSGAVSTPSPGPISMMTSSRTGAMAATMRSITLPSCRKCCPKRLRGRCGFMTLGLKPDFDKGLAAQLLDEPVELVLGFLLGEHFARLGAQDLLAAVALAHIDKLDQMPAARAVERRAELTGRKRIDHGADFRAVAAGRKPVHQPADVGG